MLVYKDGDTKEILGFQCDRCDHTTLTSVIPNDHGEFRYICPKCGYHMHELTETTEEEAKMVNTYTVSNAAKRLNCSTATVSRAIQDGRFHDCFMEAGYHGRPAWMIPSDQVEEWVTRGGFLQSTSPKNKFTSRSQVRAALEKAKEEAANKQKKAWGKDENVRMVFDPEVGKNVPVLDLLSEEDRKPIPEPKPANQLSEFDKRVVRRVAGQKYVKVLDRTTKEKLEEIKMENVRNKEILKNFAEKVEARKAELKAEEEKFNENVKKGLYTPSAAPNFKPEEMNVVNRDSQPIDIPPVSPVVRTKGGFSITIPTEMIEDMVQKQLKSEIAGAVNQLRTAFDLLNEELKKLEEAIA